MKALALVVLVLALGAGLFFFVQDTDQGRGKRVEHDKAPASASTREPTPAPRAQPEERPKAASTSPDAGSRRQSVETEAAPTEARLVLEGTVIAEGAPIPGASLALLRRDVLLTEAQTDGRGRFRLESSPLASAGTLRVTARGFVSTERSLAAKPAGGTMMLGNLRLLRGQRLTGRVLDGNERGIADAELRAEPINAGGDLLVARARSGADGKFEFSDAPPGALIVTARARGFGEQSLSCNGGTEPLLIQLQPGVELRIRVQTPRGQPVVGAEVTIQAPQDPRVAKRVAESDAEGLALFEGLGATMWSARASHPEFRPNGRQVQVTGSEETIELTPWPAIEGLVRAPGGAAPPAGTRVQALPAAAPSERILQLDGGQELRPDGSFHLGGLRAGDWRVRVAAPGFAPATSGTIKLGIEGDGHAGTIELQSGSKLELVLALQGSSVPRAEAELLFSAPTPAQLWAYASGRGASPGVRVPSGPDGRVTLENLSPGTVWIAVYAEGCPPLSSGPHIVGSGPQQPIPIELARGGRALGRVKKKSTGTPVSRAQVRIIERAGRLGFPITLATGQDGSYTSSWLPPGRYSIEAFAPEDAGARSDPVEVELKAGEQKTLDLEL